MGKMMSRTNKNAGRQQFEETVVETVPVKEFEEKVEHKVEIKEKRRFSDDDLIPCISTTPGELFMVGAKSKILYTWADIDDVTEVEYRDLIYATRMKSKYVYRPRFIIDDPDFLEQHKDIEELYGALYSIDDLKKILKMTPKQMGNAIKSLPEPAKDALMSIVVAMIDNGQFDSVQRVKVLDEIFNTELLIKLTNM